MGASSILVNKSIFLSISLISSLSLTKSFLYVSVNLLNSSSLKILVISLLLGAFNFKSSSSNSTGTLVIIVANFFDKKPRSLLSSIFSFNFPFKCSMFSINPSREPYSFKNFLAVLSPTPGRPGILSTESPIIPK